LSDRSCCVCGCSSGLEIDHKNGLYNDPRVLNVKTQIPEYFQLLCKHCNDQKRETIVIMKKTGKRYSALNIPMLKCFGIRFISGNEDFDINDHNWAVGTFWYDPVVFMEAVLKKRCEE